jgi:hypothetical protein
MIASLGAGAGGRLAVRVRHAGPAVERVAVEGALRVGEIAFARTGQ